MKFDDLSFENNDVYTTCKHPMFININLFILLKRIIRKCVYVVPMYLAIPNFTIYHFDGFIFWMFESQIKMPIHTIHKIHLSEITDYTL